MVEGEEGQKLGETKGTAAVASGAHLDHWDHHFTLAVTFRDAPHCSKL